MNRTLILVISFCVALVITAASFLMLFTSSQGAIPLDKASFIYNRAKDLVKKGDLDGGINAMIAVVNNYPDSSVTEKALRDLITVEAQKGDLAKSRYYTARLVKNFPAVKDAEKLRKDLAEMGAKTLFSPTITEDSIQYVVKKGDTLYGIAKQFHTTVELIKRVNNLQNDALAIGQKLKVVVAKFSILVEKSKNTLTLLKDGDPFKVYVVSTGKNNSTPVGTFKIEEKMVKPVWYKVGATVPPDSDQYELGTRWMGISAKGYGIHGTKNETTIGRQETAGCVRMKNAEAEELFDIVPSGTEVKIVD